MRSLKFLVVLFFIFNSTFLNAQTENLSDKITKNLRCLICQGQSVHDSDSAFANSLKILVKKKYFNAHIMGSFWAFFLQQVKDVTGQRRRRSKTFQLLQTHETEPVT